MSKCLPIQAVLDVRTALLPSEVRLQAKSSVMLASTARSARCCASDVLTKPWMRKMAGEMLSVSRVRPTRVCTWPIDFLGTLVGFDVWLRINTDQQHAAKTISTVAIGSGRTYIRIVITLHLNDHTEAHIPTVSVSHRAQRSVHHPPFCVFAEQPDPRPLFARFRDVALEGVSLDDAWIAPRVPPAV